MFSKQCKTTENSKKKKKIIILRFYDGIRFIKVLITLGTSFIENLLTCKIVKTKILEHRLIRADEESSPSFLMLRDSLINFKLQIYYQKEPKFNDV